MNIDAYKYVCNYMISNPVGYCVIGQEPSGDKIRNELDEIIISNDDMFIYKRKKPVNSIKVILQI